MWERLPSKAKLEDNVTVGSGANQLDELWAINLCFKWQKSQFVESQEYWWTDKLASVFPDQYVLALKMKLNLAMSTNTI